MIGKHNQPIYHLVYGTKHWKGLEAMKEAMRKVDRGGTFTFSDVTDVDQTFLIDYSDKKHWVQSAARNVFDRFRGQPKTIEEIHKYVIIRTPYVFRKEILKCLERMDHPRIIDVVGRRRRFTYPDRCSVTFSD